MFSIILRHLPNTCCAKGRKPCPSDCATEQRHSSKGTVFRSLSWRVALQQQASVCGGRRGGAIVEGGYHRFINGGIKIFTYSGLFRSEPTAYFSKQILSLAFKRDAVKNHHRPRLMFPTRHTKSADFCFDISQTQT